MATTQDSSANATSDSKAKNVSADSKDEVLFNANDGLTGRDGGPYLDIEAARLAEERRARVENRDPDYEKPGPDAGIQLNTARQQLPVNSVNNLPSQDNQFSDGSNVMVQALVKNEDVPLTLTETRPADVAPDDPRDDDRWPMRAALMGQKDDESKTSQVRFSDSDDKTSTASKSTK